MKRLKARNTKLEKISTKTKYDNIGDMVISGNDEDQVKAGKAFGGKKAKRWPNSLKLLHIIEFVSRLI